MDLPGGALGPVDTPGRNNTLSMMSMAMRNPSQIQAAMCRMRADSFGVDMATSYHEDFYPRCERGHDLLSRPMTPVMGRRAKLHGDFRGLMTGFTLDLCRGKLN